MSYKANYCKASPEFSLLLACARSVLSADDTTDIRNLLRHQLRWDFLVVAARRHGLLPLLHHHLHALFRTEIPAEVFSQIEELFRQNVLRSLCLTSELIKVLDLLEAEGIRTLPLKGPLLARQLYGDVTLRQYCDVDVLIEQGDFPRTKALLTKHGFRSQFPFSRRQEADYLEADSEFVFEHENHIVYVDIQWNAVRRSFPFAWSTETVWNNLRETTLAGRTVHTLAPEPLLSLLCVHGAKHLWDRLEWVAAVAELIRQHPSLNWEVVQQLARDVGAQRVLRLGLWLAHDLLCAPLPASVVATISADPFVRHWAGYIQEHFYTLGAPRAGLWESCHFHLQLQEHLGEKLQFLFHFAVTPSAGDFAFLKLPDPLFFFYYLVRPARLVGKYGWRRFRPPTAILSPHHP